MTFGDTRLPEGFWRKATLNPSGCWLWTGAVSGSGYARYWMGKKGWQAHRLAYSVLVEAVPTGLVCDHLCFVKNCVNPAHIEIVTQRENVQRGVRHHKAINPDLWPRHSHCRRGHPMNEQNQRILSDGRRDCRICRYASNAAWKRRRRLEKQNAQQG